MKKKPSQRIQEIATEEASNDGHSWKWVDYREWAIIQYLDEQFEEEQS